MVFLAGDHLGRSIARTSTGSLQHLIFLIRVRQPKINNLQRILPINQQILRFQISVNYIESMQISNPTDNLLEIPACLLLINFSMLDNIIEELTILDVLHDQE